MTEPIMILSNLNKKKSNEFMDNESKKTMLETMPKIRYIQKDCGYTKDEQTNDN